MSPWHGTTVQIEEFHNKLLYSGLVYCVTQESVCTQKGGICCLNIKYYSFSILFIICCAANITSKTWGLPHYISIWSVSSSMHRLVGCLENWRESYSEFYKTIVMMSAIPSMWRNPSTVSRNACRVSPSAIVGWIVFVCRHFLRFELADGVMELFFPFSSLKIISGQSCICGHWVAILSIMFIISDTTESFPQLIHINIGKGNGCNNKWLLMPIRNI